MPDGTSQVDKTCPKCAAPGDAVKATTGQRDLVVVDLRCKCGHTWTINITSRLGN